MLVLMRLYKKMKFSIKDFFSKFEQIHREVRIWLHLLKKSLMEYFIFCAMWDYAINHNENEDENEK